MRISYPLEIDPDPLFPRAVVGGQDRGRIKRIETSDLLVDMDFVDPHGKLMMVNGNDAADVRITNIVGIRRRDLLKWCPNCKANKAQGEFGDEGRRTEGKLRDQSWCNRCRPPA